jgi:hypothetical protein
VGGTIVSDEDVAGSQHPKQPSQSIIRPTRIILKRSPYEGSRVLGRNSQKTNKQRQKSDYMNRHYHQLPFSEFLY